MDSSEKLSYTIGFLDCWMLFKKSQNDPQVHLKAAYMFEKLIPTLAPSWTDSQIVELILEARSEDIMKKIHLVIQEKAARETMLKQLEKRKIDWSKI